jgi:hypothetical protein
VLGHDDRVKFWIHQALEYLLGALLISQAVRSAQPLAPGVAGAALVVLAATGDGPLRAFGPLPRRVHRWFDVGIALACFALPVILWSESGLVEIALLLVVGAVQVTLIAFTDYRPKPKRRGVQTRPSSDEVGRQAARVVATGVKAWRRRGKSGPS